MSTLFNRYEVIHTLANGTEAQTYRALDLISETEVVIKALHFGRLNAWKRFSLFQREAKVLATLNHPRIPRLLDFFKEETPQGLTAYLVNSWIEGESLAKIIDQRRLLDESRVLKLTEQLLWILDYLHRFQPPVVHRDLKPSNIIVNAEDAVFLIDFGGAQEVLQPMGGGGSTVIGTFGYMAPEQFAGRALPASDLYGLGASLIHLLTGRAPIEIPQKNMQLMFQGLAQGSGGLLRWLTQMVRPDLSDRYRHAEMALTQLYALTDLQPQPKPLHAPVASALNPSVLQLLASEEWGEPALEEGPGRLQSGEIIEGYRIEETLTVGSHSASYFGTQMSSGTPVFLKALHFQSLDTWKNLTLFEREVEALQRLQHQGIPRFMDSFKTQEQDVYLVTERIDAVNLEQKLAQGWRPQESDVIEIALQALDILIYLHQQKPAVVHRDLKPSNFLIDAQQQIYLIDFGGVQDHLRAQGTGGSTVIGTYGYIAPEEFLKKAVPATDLYSLGVTLLRLLSGREPTALPQEGLRFVFRQLVHCSPALQDWVEAMIEPDLNQRFRSAIQAKKVLLAQCQPPLSAPQTPLPSPPETRPAAFRFVHGAVELKVEPYTLDLKFVPRLTTAREVVRQIHQWSESTEPRWLPVEDGKQSLALSLPLPHFALPQAHRQALAAYLEQDFSQRMTPLQILGPSSVSGKGPKALLSKMVRYKQKRTLQQIQRCLHFSWAAAPVQLTLGTRIEPDRQPNTLFMSVGDARTDVHIGYIADNGVACLLSPQMLLNQHSLDLSWQCQQISLLAQGQTYRYFALILVLNFGKYAQQRIQKYNAFVFDEAADALMLVRILKGIKLAQKGNDDLRTDDFKDIFNQFMHRVLP